MQISHLLLAPLFLVFAVFLHLVSAENHTCWTRPLGKHKTYRITIHNTSILIWWYSFHHTSNNPPSSTPIVTNKSQLFCHPLPQKKVQIFFKVKYSCPCIVLIFLLMIFPSFLPAFLSFFFFLESIGVWIQGLMLARQALYHLNHSATRFMYMVRWTVWRVSLEPRPSWSLPPELLGLQSWATSTWIFVCLFS
jgi:hypothetical protein